MWSNHAYLNDFSGAIETVLGTAIQFQIQVANFDSTTERRGDPKENRKFEIRNVNLKLNCLSRSHPPSTRRQPPSLSQFPRWRTRSSMGMTVRRPSSRPRKTTADQPRMPMGLRRS